MSNRTRKKIRLSRRFYEYFGGWGQNAVSEWVGVNQGNLSRWMSGKRAISMDFMMKVMNTTDMGLEAFEVEIENA